MGIRLLLMRPTLLLINDIYLGARCEVHKIVELNKQSSFLIVNASNYSCVDWRQKLEISRGVIFASADMMKMVFLSFHQFFLFFFCFYFFNPSYITLVTSLNQNHITI
jgi:hypothetical protein